MNTNVSQILGNITNRLNDFIVEPVGPVTVSCGSVFVNSDEEFVEKLNKADKLLYWVKKHGKNKMKTED